MSIWWPPGSPVFAMKGGRIWGCKRAYASSRPQIRVSITAISGDPASLSLYGGLPFKQITYWQDEFGLWQYHTSFHIRIQKNMSSAQGPSEAKCVAYNAYNKQNRESMNECLSINSPFAKSIWIQISAVSRVV